MKLSSLIGEIRISKVNGRQARRQGDVVRLLKPDPDIVSLHSRAQNVKPGGLFVAIQGLAADGHDHVVRATVVCQFRHTRLQVVLRRIDREQFDACGAGAASRHGLETAIVTGR